MKGTARGTYTSVGIGEIRVVRGSGLLVTHALGSCLGLVAYDPMTRVAGMLHAMLPRAEIDPEGAELRPALFVETGVPRLLEEFRAAGGRLEAMVLKAAGCGSPLGVDDTFKVGERNYKALRDIVRTNRLLLAAEEIGGSRSRTLTVDVRTGEVHVSRGSERWPL